MLSVKYVVRSVTLLDPFEAISRASPLGKGPRRPAACGIDCASVLCAAVVVPIVSSRSSVLAPVSLANAGSVP